MGEGNSRIMIPALVAGMAAVGGITTYLYAQAQQAKKSKRNLMFEQYPLGPGHVTLSTGDKVTCPYHVYEGWSSAIMGVCNLQAAQDICDKQPGGYRPVQTKSGKALALISFWDFTETNNGPHTECQLTLLVSRNETKFFGDGPFASFHAMVSHDPDIYCLITELYNNTKQVVAYNNELLALNAIWADTVYDKESGSFRVVDPETGNDILSAILPNRYTNHASALFSMISTIGWSQSMALANLPYTTTRMVSRCHGQPESCLSANVTALAFTKSDPAGIQMFDPKVHKLSISSSTHTLSKGIDFEGKIVMHADNVEFCYLTPFNLPVVAKETDEYLVVQQTESD